MRSFLCLTIFCTCLFAQANEILEAENQRSIVESQLKLLKKDSQFDAKKKKVIETELKRLSQETKMLTLDIQAAKKNLNRFRSKQVESETAIKKRNNT